MDNALFMKMHYSCRKLLASVHFLSICERKTLLHLIEHWTIAKELHDDVIFRTKLGETKISAHIWMRRSLKEEISFSKVVVNVSDLFHSTFSMTIGSCKHFSKSSLCKRSAPINLDVFDFKRRLDSGEFAWFLLGDAPSQHACRGVRAESARAHSAAHGDGIVDQVAIVLIPIGQFDIDFVIVLPVRCWRLCA